MAGSDRPRGWYPRAPSTYVVRHGGPATCAGDGQATAHAIFAQPDLAVLTIELATVRYFGAAGVGERIAKNAVALFRPSRTIALVTQRSSPVANNS